MIESSGTHVPSILGSVALIVLGFVFYQLLWVCKMAAVVLGVTYRHDNFFWKEDISYVYNFLREKKLSPQNPSVGFPSCLMWQIITMFLYLKWTLARVMGHGVGFRLDCLEPTSWSWGKSFHSLKEAHGGSWVAWTRSQLN